MEQIIDQLVAARNWEGLKYHYEEAGEETRLEYAYAFGKAHLIQFSVTSSVHEQVRRSAESFRISMYDRRLAEDIRELCPESLFDMLKEMDRQAWEYTKRATDKDKNGAENSRLGFECYLLAYFLHPDPDNARYYFTKAKVFLVETHLAQLINSVCKFKCTWEPLLTLILELMKLDGHFIEGLITLLRLYNAADFQRKTAQQGFAAFLTEHAESFQEADQKRLTEFHTELQTEFLQIFLERMLNQEHYKQRMKDDLIKRSEEVKQFAITYANCPNDLDHSYFKETLVRKKVFDLISQNAYAEAFSLICHEYKTGLPEKTFFLREMLNSVVEKLFITTRDIHCVVKALQIDPQNEILKSYFLR